MGHCHRSTNRVLGDLFELGAELLLGSPEVVGLLHAEPEVRPVAAELAQAQGHLGSDCRAAREDAVERLAGHAKLAGGLGHREPQRRAARPRAGSLPGGWAGAGGPVGASSSRASVDS